MITLANIATLRAEAEPRLVEAHNRLKSMLRRLPGGTDTFAEYESFIRELQILNKLELEIIANGTATTALPLRATSASGAAEPLNASLPVKIDSDAPEARETPASGDFHPPPTNVVSFPGNDGL